MKYFIFGLIITLMLTFTAFADDPPTETWDVSQEIQDLYDQGLVSDDVLDNAKEGILIDGAIPTETASYSGRGDMVDSVSDLDTKEREENQTLASESGESLKSLSPIPSNGTAYTDPVLIGVEYAEDAEQGSLLEVIYDLLGKPVKSYHYRYQNNQQGYTVYSVQVLDYDIPWIASFLMLLLVIYCIFKAGGALLSKL